MKLTITNSTVIGGFEGKMEVDLDSNDAARFYIKDSCILVTPLEAEILGRALKQFAKRSKDEELDRLSSKR